MASPEGSTVAMRQRPLQARYRRDPATARTVKRVRTVHEAASDALHGAVEAYGGPFEATRWRFGTDAKVGGFDDLPNSGHLLCAALAACGDNTLRMLADRLDVELTALTVDVVGHVDCRGCLAVDPDARVGFDRIDMEVRLEVAPGTDPRLCTLLEETAEQLCVVLDTLRRGVPVHVSYAGQTPRRPAEA